MFENSTAQQQSPQTSRSGQPSARRSLASPNSNVGSSSIDSPSSGSQQRLKNAINLGKAVGAKVSTAQALSSAGPLVMYSLNSSYLGYRVNYYCCICGIDLNLTQKCLSSFRSFFLLPLFCLAFLFPFVRVSSIFLSFFQVNDLLRRKESSHLGDIGVTEVNKNVGAVWSCMDQLNHTTANRYAHRHFLCICEERTSTCLRQFSLSLC